MTKATQKASSMGGKAKPSYQDLLDYIEKNKNKIKYPDRKAAILRNSVVLSQLDGEGWTQLHTQLSSEEYQREKDMLIQRIANNCNMLPRELRGLLQQLHLTPIRLGRGGGRRRGRGHVWYGSYRRKR